MDYFEKYKKYKKKYLHLKTKQHGGNNKRLLIFDFDNTITKTNTEPGINIEKYQLCDLFKDEKFIEELKEFKKNGNIVAILSYGYRNIIDAFLKHNNIVDLFGTIFTPSVFGLQEGYEHIDKLDGKNKMIRALVSGLELSIDKSKIMLVDDNKDNVYRALLGGYNSLLSEKSGLSDLKKDVLLKFMKGEYIKPEMCKSIINNQGSCENDHNLVHFKTGEVCCMKKLF